MNTRKTICQETMESQADLLFDPESVPAAVRQHVAECDSCRAELRSLEATMALLDSWQAPEPTPWFDARMAAKMRTEREAPPAGFVERMRMRLSLGSKMELRPVAAGALALLLMIGGGTYMGLESHHSQVAAPSATVQDLQSLDENAQVFQQLSDVDSSDTGGGSTGSSTGNTF
ncbi:hypothetical protein C7378_3485 [Acidipila rosea]|uniref:Uncharacterized protein n=2 Tax=Acidipila rosea TaxID=768535 RepID=A0A4R1KWT4_9BACT|nr:hypothetical protein C7378_3485 [Acidipila rosea]